MKIVSKVFVFILEIIITCFVTKILKISARISIDIVYIIGFIVVLVSVLFFVFKHTVEMKRKLNDSNIKIDELIYKISEMSKMDLKMNTNEGDRLLLMSLSQNLSEPLKISLLEKAVNEHYNVLSALILANLYYSGVEYENKKIVVRSVEKAADIYKKTREYDNYGVCDWELGWIYENKLIRDAEILTDIERLKIAREYYVQSADKGYAKAYNSLGKFFYYGLGGIDKSFSKAMECYTKAANCGDIYAIMNCGFISMNRYYDNHSREDCLEEAESYFVNAASYNNAEGLLQLGIICEIKMKKDISYLDKAKEYYIKASTSVNNQYSATAYYRLGKLLNNNCILQNDDDVILSLSPRRFQDLSIECFTRAYEIFQNLESTNGKLDRKYHEYYIELLEIFKSIT